jgi:hypothetical protein
MIPAEMVRRIRIEAMDAGIQPSVIVQKAMECYWSVGSGAEGAVKQAKTKQSIGDIQPSETTTASLSLPLPLLHLKQLAVMDALLAEGRFTEQEFLVEVGKTPGVLRTEWNKDMTGKEIEIVKVVAFLISKCDSRDDFSARIKAIRLPAEG